MGRGSLPWGSTPSAGQGLRTEMSEHQRDLLNRLFITLPAGVGPELLKELAGSLGFPATQELAQEPQVARPAADTEVVDGSGPKKINKQTRIKSQGPYTRPGEVAGGAATRSASAQGAQEEESPERPADRATEGGDAEQL